MADFFSFDCEVLESRVQTTMVKNHYTLALYIEIGKDTVITKKKTLMNLSKGKI
jgi:hypothetical protein